MAQGFWQLLLPAGLQGGALAHMQPRPSSSDEDEDDGDVRMLTDDDEGWKPEYNNWWIEFLGQKGGKGISRDTWQMVRRNSCAVKTDLDTDHLAPKPCSQSCDRPQPSLLLPTPSLAAPD